MEMIDAVEGGRITIFAHYLLENNDTPFRVILDPPIGNMNQVIATQFNSIVNKHYVALNEPLLTSANNPQDELTTARDFYESYSKKNALAASDLSELIGSYLHVKTHFRVVWDVCDQFNECREEEDSGLQDKLDINMSRSGA